MKASIKQILEESVHVKKSILQDEVLVDKIQDLVEMALKTYNQGGKVLLCGNGGSAADAQHIAAELSGRFYKDRPPLNAEALHVNSSYLTAVANDYGYQEVYARMLRATGQKGDILIGLSTSGNSENVVNAFKTAKLLHIKTVALTGLKGGELENCSDLIINIPSEDTPRIQECHITIGHIFCQLIERELF